MEAEAAESQAQRIHLMPQVALGAAGPSESCMVVAVQPACRDPRASKRSHASERGDAQAAAERGLANQTWMRPRLS